MTFSDIQDNMNRCSFHIADIDLSIVNSIRRIVLAEVPSIAVTFDPLTDKNPDITFVTNKTSLHNEYLGHRISLIPMCFSDEEIESFDKEKYVFK